MFQPSDFRYALRLWRRYPSLVVVAGLSLGLGVGATTTMFSVVNNVSNYKLHFKDVDRLAVLWTTDKEQGNGNRTPDWETVQAVLAARDTRSRRSASSRAVAHRSRCPASR